MSTAVSLTPHSSLHQLRALVRGLPAVAVLLDRSGRCLAVSRRLAAVVGEPLPHDDGTLQLPFDPPPRWREAAERALGGRPADAVPHLLPTTGGALPLVWEAEPWQDADGAILGAVLVGAPDARGAEARRVADAELAAALRRQAIVLETIGDAVIATDLDGVIVDWNPAAERLYGYTREEMLGRRPSFLHDPAAGQAPAAAMADALARDGRWSGDVHFRRKDGTRGLAEVVAVVHRDIDGRAVGRLGIGRDATARWRIERALRASEDRYELIARATNDVIYDWDIASGRLEWNEALPTALRHDPSTGPFDMVWWQAHVHPEDRERIIESLERALAGDSELWSAEYRFRRGDGTWAFLLERGCIRRDESGTPVRMVGLMVDRTERRQLEEQLQHAQKMEAIGQLAGGIAHDFNNITTVMQLHTEFLLEGLHVSDPRRRDVEEVARAATRAADLTRQLLAFSRRQMLAPATLDLNDVVRDTVRMLRRTIGENVTLATALAASPWPLLADAGQLGQVVMNLALNARDAMPKGGCLTIETANVAFDRASPALFTTIPRGEYVRLTVRDTGCGMDAATRARMFEPFFTTKGVGQGTGLGLAMVYGIVKQSGGFIRVDSTPAVGTEISIYLPRMPHEAPSQERTGTVEAPARGAGTVLLVEDEPAVRTLVRRVLHRQGFRVVEARSGREALELAAGGAAVDLLLTDAVMPEMSGVDLIAALRAERPELPVLLMSGYTDADVERGGLDGVVFLPKPFTAQQLAARVCAVLAGAP